MDLFSTLAVVALLATIVMLVRGIVSMARGEAADYEPSTRLMLQRVEFQSAAVTLVLAAIFLGIGWFGTTTAPSDRLTAHLGVLPAEVIEKRYGHGSAEAKAFGGISENSDAYLVTVAITNQATDERVEDADVTATVAPLGLSGARKQLKPAKLAGALTYGNYFRMPKSGIYQVDVVVQRPDSGGSDLIRLEYHRP